MSATIETVADLRRIMSFHIPAERIASAVQQRLRKLAREVRIDGFRPGKIPMSVIEHRFKTSVVEEVVNAIAKSTYDQEIGLAKLRPAFLPEFAELPEEKLAVACTEGAAIQLRFEVLPDVELADLENVEIERWNSEVDEETINKTIQHLRKQTGTFVAGEPGSAAEMGDRATVDFDGKIDGESFEGGQAKDMRFLLGENFMPAEFEKAIEGMTAGESKTFQLTFPATYRVADIAGKTADFMVTLHSIEKVVLPEMSPQWIQSVGVTDGTIESLRKEIRKNLDLQRESRLFARNRDGLMQALFDHYHFAVPEVLVRKRTKDLLYRRIQAMKEQGYDLQTDSLNIPSQFLDQVRCEVHWMLVVNDLAAQHGLIPQDAQVVEHIRRLASSYQEPDAFEKEYVQDDHRMGSLRLHYSERNVVDYLYQHAKVVDKTVPFSELIVA
ncbi:trigger factor [Candidatus Symbiobacter mobilis]|uniref:Trigger factor n=1 Tax=Candidatus Symbiobacter mobilis CR TaxID=946483 RepID=U5N928_9BURK|nr:trigger factor [Candidatus Symbiobacter mobilis]AGX86768.1 trigger factor [Candidatus Symbiobacter mobilis CR]